jgi:hypothetical protein
MKEGDVNKDMAAPRRRTDLIALIPVALFLAGLGLGLFGPEDLYAFSQEQPVLSVVGAGVIVTLATVAGFLWMQRIDELAQRAHYVAWYWGGSTGLAVLLFVLFAGPGLARMVDVEAVLAPLELIWGPAAGIMAGIVISLVTLTAGYLLWWAFYWIRKQ